MYIKNRVMKFTDNDILKEDLNNVLKKHGVGADEAMIVLDEIFYDRYNGDKTTHHFTKGNSE